MSSPTPHKNSRPQHLHLPQPPPPQQPRQPIQPRQNLRQGPLPLPATPPPRPPKPHPTTTTTTTSGSNALVLTKAQRVCLWKGGWRAVPSDWRWVYDGSEAEWEGFRERLVDAVRRDGYKLEFVCLVGADYVRRGSAWLPWGDWGCGGIVVGEVGRSADFVAVAPTGGSSPGRVKLYRLMGCEDWEVVKEDMEAAYVRATDRVEWVAGALSIVSLDTLRRLLGQGTLAHLSGPDLFLRAPANLTGL
ncbi:hypothetical protein C8A01DRAFT_37946 [Parachaetomium inaequale]|uniref:Uncharacterized protein n=1 Tax=Parachaetomium inaequale TaxID=2588326 RepID=A0AAN6SQ99_9PEZI|nr:hypothetical protein C8A01DRAFT_37946 [Parachaetomium inaequale]